MQKIKYLPLRSMLFLLFLISSFGAPLKAQDRGLGLGIILGEPTGISMKDWLTPTTAVDAALAWSFSRETSFDMHVDYLWHSFHDIKTQHEIPLYYGVGGRIKSGNTSDTRVGVRGVVGVEYFMERAPVDIFLEVAPIMDLAPSTGVSFNAGLGIRYFFD